MNIIYLFSVIILFIGISIWILLLILLNLYPKAKCCKFLYCGYYNNNNNPHDINDHKCQIDKIEFDKLKNTNQSCKQSSIFIGYPPTSHETQLLNIRKKNIYLIIAGIFSYLCAWITAFLK